MESSEVAEYYANKTIFVTGGTGYLGKALISKLLRSCPRLKKIYVLVRPKNRKSAKQRLRILLNCAVFINLPYLIALF